MGYVRTGKTASVKVVPGERKPLISDGRRVLRFHPEENWRKRIDEIQSKMEDSAWEGFSSMKVSRVADHNWRAEIEFAAKDGKKVNREFTGTREEIRTAIHADKELPVRERVHLLRALGFHLPVFELHFSPNVPGE